MKHTDVLANPEFKVSFLCLPIIHLTRDEVVIVLLYSQWIVHAIQLFRRVVGNEYQCSNTAQNTSGSISSVDSHWGWQRSILTAQSEDALGHFSYWTVTQRAR